MTTHHAVAKNARIGLILFFIYLVFYGGFVYLSAFHSDAMAAHAVAGVNVAVMYGFSLIVVALVMALIYLQLCHPVDESGPGEKLS